MLNVRIGEKYSLLTLLSISEKRSRDNHVVGNWICDCGNSKQIMVSRVVRERTKSCGCLVKKAMPGLKHGMKGTPTYSSWTSAKDRTLNPSSKDYERYGAVGIVMCKEWAESFEAFYLHMGDKPEGTSLDRIDNESGYEPGNCRWATDIQQQQNKKTSFIWTVRGIVFQSAPEAAKHFRVASKTIEKWVLGYFDKRRDSFTESKDDCYRVSRY